VRRGHDLNVLMPTRYDRGTTNLEHSYQEKDSWESYLFHLDLPMSAQSCGLGFIAASHTRAKQYLFSSQRDVMSDPGGVFENEKKLVTFCKNSFH
jgi:hypothetical protein